jgi:hypothetical protein
MVAAHHPPPHPDHRPSASIVRRQTNRWPQFTARFVILRNVSLALPAFPIARPAHRQPESRRPTPRYGAWPRPANRLTA